MVEPLVGAIALPDGTLIRGRGRREPVPDGPLPDFGLYLGRQPGPVVTRGPLPSAAARRTRRFPFPWPTPRWTVWRPDWSAEWVDWPDFRVPRDDQLAAAAIERAYRLARAGRRVEVACGGGTGRTGTVIACMVVLAGQTAADAVAWTRRYYRPRAIETRGQRRWIEHFAVARRPCD
ncbi:MAG: protein-tyrosine phosphatase family protein [Frankia sp.]